MKKHLSTLVFMFLGYILPLVGAPFLLLDFKMIILLLACIVVFMTQPTFSIEAAQRDKQEDGNSILYIFILSIIAISAPIIEWAYFKPSPVVPAVFVGLGTLVLIIGVGLRVWSIKVLGEYFTATVQTKTDQKVIDYGPYRNVRHPSYLGAFIAFMGNAIILEAWAGLLIAFIAMSIAYNYRIKKEEETLLASFGKAYQEYQMRTKKLFPYVW